MRVIDNDPIVVEFNEVRAAFYIALLEDWQRGNTENGGQRDTGIDEDLKGLRAAAERRGWEIPHDGKHWSGTAWTDRVRKSAGRRVES